MSVSKVSDHDWQYRKILEEYLQIVCSIFVSVMQNTKMSTGRICVRFSPFENKDIADVGMGQFPAVYDIYLFMAYLTTLSVAQFFLSSKLFDVTLYKYWVLLQV
jgi:hypothetical protein